MSREDFISDRLVDIRQRFRQPAGEMKGSSAPENSALPAMRGSGETAAADRDRRDLEGRLRRDSAQVSRLLEIDEQRRKETELFGKTVDECLQGILALEDGSKLSYNEYSRKVEELRIKYFSAYGRFSAQNNGELPLNFSLPGKETPGSPNFLPLILTIAGGSLLIALAIIISMRL